MSSSNTSSDVICNSDKLELSRLSSPFFVRFKTKNFDDPKHEAVFIHNIESVVRRSPEYKKWRNYVIDDLGAIDCSITGESGTELTVEVHHHIPTLFVLVKAFITRCILNEQSFTSFGIAEEVMKYHFKNRIGYVSIVKSLHEKHHNGFFQIPMSVVIGNYQAFMDDFSECLDEEDLQTLQAKLKVNESNCGWQRNLY